MLDVVYSEFVTPQAGDEWRAAMRARAESTRERVRATPVGHQHQGPHLARAPRPLATWIR